jgi:threonine aldolase
MHLDGARLFNAATAQAALNGQTAHVYDEARAICSGFDSVSLCLSKGLGAPVGSLLLGSAALVAKAKRIRKMLGGGMRQAGVIASAGLYALQHQVQRLADDHALLAQLVQGLAEAAEANPKLRGQFSVVSAQTNIAFTDIHAQVAPALLAHLKACGVWVNAGLYGSQTTRARWVTHLDLGPADAGVLRRPIQRNTLCNHPSIAWAAACSRWRHWASAPAICTCSEPAGPVDSRALRRQADDTLTGMSCSA